MYLLIVNVSTFMIINSLEMWSFELMVLLSGLLPNPQLETAVLSVWFELFTSRLMQYLPIGLSSKIFHFHALLTDTLHWFLVLIQPQQFG